MKKLLLAALLASTSSLAFANGIYVQGDVGYSKLEFKDEVKLKENATSFRVAVGKDAGDVRYQADYTHFGKVDDKDEYSDNFVNYKDELELKVNSLGLSAVYDFAPVSGVTPYAGARLGVNQVDADYDYTETRAGIVSRDSGSEKETKVGAGVLAGVQYAFTPNLALDAGVEYNYLGKFDELKVNQYGAKVGLRYNF